MLVTTASSGHGPFCSRVVLFQDSIPQYLRINQEYGKLVQRWSHPVYTSCRTSAAVMDWNGFCHRKIGVAGQGRTPPGASWEIYDFRLWGHSSLRKVLHCQKVHLYNPIFNSGKDGGWWTWWQAKTVDWPMVGKGLKGGVKWQWEVIVSLSNWCICFGLICCFAVVPMLGNRRVY